jgi:hypothetical protein
MLGLSGVCVAAVVDSCVALWRCDVLLNLFVDFGDCISQDLTMYT